MKEAERAIRDAVAYLRTQPDCKTAAGLLMKKLQTEKLMIETMAVRVTAYGRKR